MKLIEAQVENFKCVEDSKAFRIDQVTCLIGKNEAGKTALLEALYKLNPVDKEKANFVEGSIRGGIWQLTASDDWGGNWRTS